MCSDQSPDENRKEFETLALQYMDSLYGVALRMTRDATEAQDLVQDAYLRAYRFFDKFKKGTNFRAWLFKILRNVYINKYRKKLKAPMMIDASNAEIAEELQSSINPENDIFDKLLDDDVKNAIDELPDDFRDAIVLSDIEGFSYKEIADILNCPIGTVMSRLHRGRKLLRESLYDYAKNQGYLKDK